MGRSTRSTATVAVLLAVLALALLAWSAPPMAASGPAGASRIAARISSLGRASASRGAASPGGWTELNVTPAPPPMGGSTMASDPGVNGVVLYGGDGTSQIFNTTWVFNDSRWTNVTATAAGPGPRSGVALAYDAAEGGVVLYGGISPNGNVFYNDTWLFRDGQWQNITATAGTGPGPLGAATMDVDPSTGDPVLFGGAYYSGGFFSQSTWEFANGTWVDLTATAGTPPPPRVFAGFASDPAIEGLVLFGGQQTDGATYNDTWTFVNGTWAPRTDPSTASPGPRRSMQFVDDATYGAPVLFEGDTSGTGTPVSSTWMFTAAERWVNVTGVVGAAPTPRWAGMAAWDGSAGTDGAVLAFGGCQALGCAAAVNDTWTFAVAPPGGNVTAASLSTPVGVEDLFVAGGTGGFPPYTFAYNFGDGSVVARSQDPAIDHAFAADGFFPVTVTTWDSVSGVAASAIVRVLVTEAGSGPHLWTEVATPAAPPPGGGGVYVYDPALSETLAFGGTRAGGAVGNATWTLGSSGWTNRTSTVGLAPSARTGAAAWYDPTVTAVVVFGGENAAGSALNDTWEFNGRWTNVTGRVGAAPPVRSAASSVESSVLGEAILFGGRGGADEALGDTWAFEGSGWQNLAPSGAVPPSRWGAALALAPGAPSVVLYGGSGCGGGLCRGTWTFSAGTWTLQAAIGAAPPPGTGAAFALDAAYGASLLFGGTAGIGAASNATWSWNGSAWANVTSDLGPGPSSRSLVAFTSAVGGPGLEVSAGCAAVGCAAAEEDTWTVAPPALSVAVATTPGGSTDPAESTDTPTISGGLGAVRLSWAFGDGTFNNTTIAAVVSHTYAAVGTYHATLQVEDAGGTSNETVWSVTVTTTGTGAGGGGTNNSTPPTNKSKHGTTPVTSTPPPKPFWQGAVLDWVLGGAALLAVLIVAIAFVRYRGSGGRSTSVPTSAPRSGRPPPGPGLAPPGPEAEPPVAGAGLPIAAGALSPAPPSASPADEPIRSGGASDAGAESGTLGDRILVHLHRQGRLGPEELAPNSITQAGLADALGRPQSAFARTLQRLETTGLVSTELRHVRGAARRLKVYRLTSTGEAKALDLRRRAGPDAPARPGP